jgi:hypothetical protein
MREYKIEKNQLLTLPQKDDKHVIGEVNNSQLSKTLENFHHNYKNRMPSNDVPFVLPYLLGRSMLIIIIPLKAPWLFSPQPSMP